MYVSKRPLGKRPLGIARKSQREDPELTPRLFAANIWRDETLYQGQTFLHWQPRKFLTDRDRWRRWMSLFFPDDFPPPTKKKIDLSKYEVVNEKNLPRPFVHSKGKGKSAVIDKGKVDNKAKEAGKSTGMNVEVDKGKDTSKSKERDEKRARDEEKRDKRDADKIKDDAIMGSIDKKQTDKSKEDLQDDRADRKQREKTKEDKIDKKRKEKVREEELGQDRRRKHKEKETDEKRDRKEHRRSSKRREQDEDNVQKGSTATSVHQIEPKVRGKETHTSRLRATIGKQAAEDIERLASHMSIHEPVKKKRHKVSKVKDSKSVIFDAKKQRKDKG